MIGALGAQIGFQALGSFWGSRGARKQAQTQNYLSQAQAYQNQAREFAQLRESVMQQGRVNEAIAKTEAYNLGNMLSNRGAMSLADSQLRQAMSQTKLQLRTEGRSAKGSIETQAGAVGAVGASVRAMQSNVDKQMNKTLADVSQARRNQIYDNRSQARAMFTQYAQSIREIDTSEIDSAFLPQDPINLNRYGMGSGGFLPHLIGASLSVGGSYAMDSWSLDL